MPYSLIKIFANLKKVRSFQNIVILDLKKCNPFIIEIICMPDKKSSFRANMTVSAVMRALENPILTEFPYELSDDSNFDDLTENVGYRYTR